MIPPATISKMSDSANDAISKALLHIPAGMKQSPRTEPGLVAAVHLRALPAIGKAWASQLAAVSLKLKLSGVFCHQSPMVIYHNAKGLRKRCELADLLLVVDTETGGVKSRKATLIQAKMAGKAGTVSPNGISSLTQLELYQRWPIFDFEQASYNLTSVDIRSPADWRSSGTFGVIDRHWHSARAPKWTQHPASPTPHKTKSHPDLGAFMARMVGGVPDYGRAADVSSGTKWAEMIEILLKENQSRMFSHSPSLGKGTHPRHVSALAMMRANAASIRSSGAGGPPDGDFLAFEDLPPGVSTIYVQVSDLIPDEEG